MDLSIRPFLTSTVVQKKTQAAQTAPKTSEPRPAAPEESAFETENLLATLSHTEEYAALRQA